VEEAVKQALVNLKAQRNQVEVSVISEGGGFLGGDAVVRVSFLKEGEERSYFDEYDTSYDDDCEQDTDSKNTVLENTLSQESIVRTQQVLSEFLQKMGYGYARVEVLSGDFVMPGEDAGVSTVFNIRGENLGALIGRKNQTLISLQYLLRLMVFGQVDDYVPIIVDVNGTRQKRFRELKGLALRMADQVIAKKMPFALEPMSPFDRRIVHMVLADHPKVTTQSVGAGESRKVIVLLRS